MIMKLMQSILMALLLLFLSACFDFNSDKATRNTINVINMKVGASTKMRVFFEEPYESNYYNNLFFDDWSDAFIYDPYPYALFPNSETLYYAKGHSEGKGSAARIYDSQTYYTSIEYTYDYTDSKQYYLNITNRSFLMIETDESSSIKVPASHLRNREQSLVIFGSSSAASLRIPLDVRVFTNVKSSDPSRVSINFINALPTQTGTNMLPELQYPSTLHLEVEGVRVSERIDYRENDRLEIAGVNETLTSIELTLVLGNGAARIQSKKLQNGHTYNVIAGHSQNRLSAEPTLYVYDVTPATDNT